MCQLDFPLWILNKWSGGQAPKIPLPSPHILLHSNFFDFVFVFDKPVISSMGMGNFEREIVEPYLDKNDPQVGKNKEIRKGIWYKFGLYIWNG